MASGAPEVGAGAEGAVVAAPEEEDHGQGRAMVMDRHGRVPTSLKMAEAPLWLFELLVPGKFSHINWELVYAAAMEIKLTPLDHCG